MKRSPEQELGDAADREMSRFETARHWRHPAVAGVDLLHARYVTYSFTRHTHSGYAVGVIRAGVEAYDYRGTTHHAGVGQIVLVEPDSVHTGSAGTADGWAYQMFYPEVEVLSSIAADVQGARGAPHFPTSVVTDPLLARLLVAGHRASDAGDRLTAGSLTWQAMARLVNVHASGHRRAPSLPAGARTVSVAQEILVADLVDAPSLEELARTVGCTPFALVRAFRAQTGLPPHRWLIQQRVSRARGLLDRGETPAIAAVSTGFTDQAHLTRHFKRIVGVPPGAYAAERKNVQAIGWPSP